MILDTIRNSNGVLLRRLLGLCLVVALLPVFGLTAIADGPFLNVDGTVYSPSQTSGPVRHYETPDTNPVSAFSDRHTWTGNGSEHLPCENGIHWVDNSQLLTISNCLEGEDNGTTTTTEGSTTTTEPSTTTTVERCEEFVCGEETTTTTEGCEQFVCGDDTTTTTTPSTTTSEPEVTTTTVPVVTVTDPPPVTVPETDEPETTQDTLPRTGMSSSAAAIVAALALALGAGLMTLTRNSKETS